MNKKRWITAILLILLIAAVVFNPTSQEYEVYSEKKYSEHPDTPELEHKIIRKNFILFSSYTPVVMNREYGVTHIGVLGVFFPISDGQYDGSWYLDFFR